MYFLKRVSIFILLVLLFISLYKDLTIGTSYNKENPNPSHLQPVPQKKHPFDIIKVKLKPGDTVLSVTEELNHTRINSLDISKIVNDFKIINPYVNPHDLKLNTYYHFPLY